MQIKKLIIFLVLNFAALGIGGIFTSDGVSSAWYANLDKAPWTPPGWVFGAAWTLIMGAFAVYMTYLWPRTENKQYLAWIFGIQWCLNVVWNPIFFYFHHMALGLFVITALTIILIYMYIKYHPKLKSKSFLLAPYILWLGIATSLNAYIWLQN